MDLSTFNPFYTPISSPQAQADLAFLLPIDDVSALINNLTFTATLGCSVADQNITCTSVCNNVTSVFDNWSNLYTCSWLPVLSNVLDHDDSSSNASTSLGSLGISSGQNEFVNNTSITIATCLSDYCQSSSLCVGLDIKKSCSLDSLLQTNATTSTLDRVSVFDCVRDSVCGSIVDVNPDIGGLGVVLSLLIQYCIPIFALNLHYFLFLRHQTTQKRIAKKTSLENLQQALSKSKNNYDGHLSALTSALVEFQKAQCFFAVTLQIAALIVLPQSLQGMHSKDQILLRLTSANGFSPIMLTLAHIDFLGGRNSWYLLFLSGVTFTLGTATYWYTSPEMAGGPINWYTEYTNPAAPLPSCGNVAPFAPCFVRNQFQDYKLWPKFQGLPWYNLPQKLGLVVWVVCLGIFLYRLGYKICHIRNNWKRLSKHLANFRLEWKTAFRAVATRIKSYKQGAIVLSLLDRISTVFQLPQLFALLLDIGGKSQSWDRAQLLLGYLSLIAQIVSVIIVMTSSTDLIATQMTFGQIVAVGIWVPVFLEYAYLEINGVEEGTEYRLKEPLVVVAGSGHVQGASTQASPAPL